MVTINTNVEFWDVLDKDGNKTGKYQERGWMQPGNYHLIVHIWIINNSGEYLIAKRTPNKRWKDKWGTTLGSAVMGDDSITTALKEVKEELGIVLDSNIGILFKRYRNDITDDCGEFHDVWIFNQNVDINKVVLQVDETNDVMYASKDKVINMIEEGIFVPIKEACPYIYELFEV